MKRSHAVHDAVRAHFHGVVHEHSHSGLYSRLDEEHFLIEVDPRHLTERPIHWRHHGTDDDAADGFWIQVLQREKIAREDAVFIDSLQARSRKTPVRDQIHATEYAENAVGVSDVNRQ